MPEIIVHRVNSIADLRRTPHSYGVEFDVRSRGSRLVLAHNAFKKGEALNPFLDYYARSGRKGLLIFNPKENNENGK